MVDILVVGVHLTHLVFIDFLKPIATPLFFHPVLDLWLTATIFFCSVLAAMIMLRTPVLKSFVEAPRAPILLVSDQAMTPQKVS